MGSTDTLTPSNDPWDTAPRELRQYAQVRERLNKLQADKDKATADIVDAQARFNSALVAIEGAEIALQDHASVLLDEGGIAEADAQVAAYLLARFSPTGKKG